MSKRWSRAGMLQRQPGGKEKWVRVVDDMGFPAGGARTMTADLTGKLPPGTRRIRITTNLQIYWDNILISRTSQDQNARLTPVPLARAELEFPRLPAEDRRPAAGQREIHLRKGERHRPYTRPAGAYTRYGDVRPLLESIDDKFVSSDRAMKLRSISIPRNCPLCRAAGCAIISSSPTDTKKIWTSTPIAATRSILCPSATWRPIRIPAVIPVRCRAHELPTRIQHPVHVGE
jgi:hypothetical protein